MYLKKVEIQGFKSFADKTEIKFNNDITAIVGPNGSGKSNITDAIRWVLGEQSIKNLRGGKMEDVIFSGTDKRRPLGFAEVTIFFDNQDGDIPMDYNEVAITRRIFRSGESEYYINKNSCRLKDIRELFMDTGIGKDGYSIIGQGRIDEILSNKPEDRRNIFEEAAGIIKYKSKKEEAERKLKSTEENIIRIRDLIHEISNQAETLEKESKKATDFIKIYDELKELEVNLYTKDIKKYKNQINEIKVDVNKLSSEIKDLENRKVKIEKEFNLSKSNIEDIDGSIKVLNDNRIKVIQSYEKDKNQISIILEKEKFYKRDIERLSKERELLDNSIKRLSDETLEDQEQRLNILDKYETLKTGFALKNEQLNSINTELLELEESLEKRKNEALEVYNKISQKKSELNSIDSLNANIDKRLNQLKLEIHEIDEDRKKCEINQKDITKKENKLKEILKDLNLKYENYQSEKNHLEKEFEELLEKIKSKEIMLQGILSSYNLYKNMEEGYEGYYKSVKNLLKGIKYKKIDGKGFIGTVAELLKVDEVYEKAIDISLGSSLQNIVMETELDAKLSIDYLKSNNMGRVTFLPLDTIKGNSLNIDLDSLYSYGFLGLGHNLIEYDYKYEDIFKYLLGRTIIVDNINNAIRLANRYKHRYKIVTLEGDVLNPGGSLTGGSYNNNAISLISRKNKIDSLKNQIDDLRTRLSEFENRKTGLWKHIQEKDRLIIKVSTDIKQIEQDIKNIYRENESYKNELYRLDKDANRVSDEIKILQEESSTLISKGKEDNIFLRELIKESNIIKDDINYISSDVKDKKSEKENLSNEVSDLRISINTIENKLKSVELNIQNKLSQKEEAKISSEEKKEMLIFIDNELKNIENEKALLLNQIELKNKEENRISKKLESFTLKKEEQTQKFYKQQESLEEINHSINILERQKNSSDLKLSKFELQLENIFTKLHDEYELTFENALEIEKELIDTSAAREHISKLKKKIKSLGNVNLGSIEEYKNTKERLEFIMSQHEDLINSKEDLRKIIKDMEKKMRVQFIESFNNINSNFSKVFSILFNGGKASLELNGDENILNSGIEIQVQPPGKKLQNLSLLSGGEKSLTAVALLFAILQTKPSPFCILDEIDAALDESNISRYIGYLKKFNNDTQFIMITHRKTTMEAANVLYGVTMTEEGVSKLISVKLKDYTESLVS